MRQYTKILMFLALWDVFGAISGPYLYAQKQTEDEFPFFNPAAVLVQDEAVRAELALQKQQRQMLDRVCQTLDPLLFSLRDVPADTTDTQSLQQKARIMQKIREVDDILNSSQKNRLRQLCLQYEAMGAFLYPQVQSRLGLTAAQIEQILQIHRQSLAQQQEVMQQSPDRNTDAVQRRIQELQDQQANQIFQVMNSDQRNRWRTMLGRPFDFSRTRPVSFRVPGLRNVTAWVNSGPISMEDLRGRVVIVHFWTFGCSNCIQNYPVYKQWVRQYDPNEVFMLGIHTPETEHEKDITLLRKRMEQEGLTFAIAADNNRANWDAWSNRVWPAVYLVDKAGCVRYWWYGELRWQGAAGDRWMTERIEELRAE